LKGTGAASEVQTVRLSQNRTRACSIPRISVNSRSGWVVGLGGEFGDFEKRPFDREIEKKTRRDDHHGALTGDLWTIIANSSPSSLSRALQCLLLTKAEIVRGVGENSTSLAAGWCCASFFVENPRPKTCLVAQSRFY
jgi:hypothetical protein